MITSIQTASAAKKPRIAPLPRVQAGATDYKHIISTCEQHDTLVPHRHNEIIVK